MRLIIPLALIVLAISCLGCLGGLQSNWTIEDARQFDEFDLYWLGESYESLPLTIIYRAGEPSYVLAVENNVTFVYGDRRCTNGSDCSKPLRLDIQRYCDNPPEKR